MNKAYLTINCVGMVIEMAYNSFVVIDCKKRKTILCTQSARKASAMLEKGRRIEIWNDGAIIKKVYSKNPESMTPYVRDEKDHIRQKQKNHEQRNQRRKEGKQ